MGRVLLLNMPFVALDRPSIAISLLKSRLTQVGIECRVAYGNLLLAEKIGSAAYRLIDEKVNLSLFAGDWLFSQHLFGNAIDQATYINLIRSNVPEQGDVETILGLRESIQSYLDDCIEHFRVSDHDVIGFTSTYQQNLASLALARLIKQRYPEKTIVFGGANCEADMGLELHRSFTWIDYVFSGESDNTFPEFLKQLFSGMNPRGIPGVTYRENGQSIMVRPGEPIHAMDELPIPDYDDYFESVRQSSFSHEIHSALPIENSRGCWWGAKSHCTFCGLNGATMTYRAKSAPRVLEEIQSQKRRYGINHFVAVDNILAHNYFTDLLPMLKESKLGVTMFYEIKSNLDRQKVQLLSESGVRMLQPGVESLSSHVLQLMRKGVSGIQNVQLLKWCREYDVQVAWNLLYGFPGETENDYSETAATIEAIYHLTPPCAVAPVRLDRFSPYFNDPKAWGLQNVRPFGIYGLIYPLPVDRIANLAYFFEYDYADGRQPGSYMQQTLERVATWNQNRGGNLVMEHAGNPELALTDTRPGRPAARYELNGVQREVYLYCEEARPFAKIRELARKCLGTSEEVDRWLETFLAQMIEFRLMVRENERYLSLAITSRSATA